MRITNLVNILQNVEIVAITGLINNHTVQFAT